MYHLPLYKGRQSSKKWNIFLEYRSKYHMQVWQHCIVYIKYIYSVIVYEKINVKSSTYAKRYIGGTESSIKHRISEHIGYINTKKKVYQPRNTSTFMDTEEMIWMLWFKKIIIFVDPLKFNVKFHTFHKGFQKKP